MIVDVPIHVLVGLLVLSVLAIALLILIPFGWKAMNRRYDAMMESHKYERRGWEARDRDAWLHVDQLAREIAEVRGALNVRRAKRARDG